MKWWQSSPAEGSAVPRAAFQGCFRSFLVWSLRWCQRQPPPFLIQSRGPETPCDTTSCPRGAQACGWGRATRYGGHISRHCHRPPVPAAPRAAWRGPALSNPGHKPAGRPGEGILASPSRQEVGQQNAAGAATRDNRVATVQSVIQQTATCRGTRLSPTDQQPNLTLKCLKLQHEQTHLHIWKQLALEAAIWKFSLVM